MKTISTKIDSQIYQRLLESCGKSNCSVSEKVRRLIEDSVNKSSNNTSMIQPEKTLDNHESHYDRFGNYWSFNTEKNRWTVSLNPKNIRIIA